MSTRRTLADAVLEQLSALEEEQNEMITDGWGKHHGRYILSEDGVPVPCEDLYTWGTWLEDCRATRVIQQEYVGPYWVSTVFLALDHNWGVGPPLLYETMVFIGDGRGSRADDDFPMERYPTRELALEGHLRAVGWARQQGASRLN